MVITRPDRKSGNDRTGAIDESHPTNEALVKRRRFLTMLAATAGWTLFGLPWPVHSDARSAVRTATLGRLLMGTVVESEASHPDLSVALEACRSSLERIAKVDRLMSIFRSDSELSLVNRTAWRKPIVVGTDTFTVLAESERLAHLTGGALDVTIHPLMQLWTRSATQARVPSRHELDAALGVVGFGNLVLDKASRSVRLRQTGAGIDLGGIAKGYAVDVAVEALRVNGIRSGMVNAGGDLRVLGRNPNGQLWRIGLRHPLSPERLILSLLVEDESVATSGSYFRYFTIAGRQYGHVLFPRTGLPAEAALSTTVIASHAVRADGLATGAHVLGSNGAHALMRRAGVEGIVISAWTRRPEKLVVQLSPGLRHRVELMDSEAVMEV